MKLTKAGTLYVECAVHGWMQGNVVVVDNPYYAVIDESGTSGLRICLQESIRSKSGMSIWES